MAAICLRQPLTVCVMGMNISNIEHVSTALYVLYASFSVASSASSSFVDANDPRGLSPLQRVAAYEGRLTPKPCPPGAVPLSSLFAVQRPKSSGTSKTLRSVKHRPSSSSVSSRGGGSGLVKRQPTVVQVVREPNAVRDHLPLQEREESHNYSAKDHVMNNIARIR